MLPIHKRSEPKPHKTWWRLWAKSLGQKTAYGDTEADIITCIRAVFVLTNFITCLFIIAIIIRYW